MLCNGNEILWCTIHVNWFDLMQCNSMRWWFDLYRNRWCDDDVMMISVNASGGSNFVLSSGFPPVEIIDPTQTVAEASLLGASIILKIVWASRAAAGDLVMLIALNEALAWWWKLMKWNHLPCFASFSKKKFSFTSEKQFIFFINS